MNVTSNFIRNFWLKIQLSVPSNIQPIIPSLHEAKEVSRLLTKLYLPIYELQGEGYNGPLSVTYAGLEFAKPFLKDILFTDHPVERKIGQVPFWNYKQLSSLSSSDITIVEATKHLVNRIPSQTAIILPEFVRHVLDVRGEWRDVRSRFRKTVRKNDLRKVRKYGYEYDVSHNTKDFEEFYHKMYLPTMNSRHKDLSMPESYKQAYQLFLNGCLFRIKRSDVWVAGGVCHPEQNVLMLDIVGVRNADEQLIQDGAMIARYYAAIHWANQQGYKAVNFRGSNPYMSLGQFQYKRKWGTSVHLPPHLHRRIWIKINRKTPAVIHFLTNNPLIIVDKNNDLHGLISVDTLNEATSKTQTVWKKHYETPGLNSLIIRPIDNFISFTTEAPSPELVIPISSNSWEGD